MNIQIFVEDSGTTADTEAEMTVMDYYVGGFLTVTTVARELAEYGDVSAHVLSDVYGYCHGDDHIGELEESSDTASEQAQFAQAVKDAAAAADVIVILLTSSVYRATVTDQWDDLMAAAGPESIWCLGASQKALAAGDLDALRSAVDQVITYQRVGVARIDKETRNALNTAVEQRDCAGPTP